MCCGVHRDELIVRIDPADTDKVLAQKHVRIFDITGRPIQGWILVSAAGLSRDDALTKWVGMAVDYVRSLPAK